MKQLILLVWLVAGSSAYAQQVLPSSTTTYFDKEDKPLASAQGAEYRLESEYTDSIGGVQRQYAPDNHLIKVMRFSNFRNRILDGITEEYYPSGQLELLATYNQGKLEGEIVRYYPNGQLQRREQFKDYMSLGGECFDEAGKPVAFFPHIVFPQYAGGMAGLSQELGSKMKYPLKARVAGQEARVFIDFVVDVKGKVQKAKVRDAGFPLLDNEALRVVKSLSRWIPGQIEGKPAEVEFTLPVTFALQ